MKHPLLRLFILLLLATLSSGISLSAHEAQPNAASLLVAMTDSTQGKDTLTTSEAATKARFDSLERHIAAPVDTLSLFRSQRKGATPAPLQEATNLQRRLKQQFVPNPQRALWLALVLPGAGQIYNRKYWKLPLFYGGFLGCTYAFLWNQQMYMDYSQAYLDIMDDDPLTNSFRNLFPPTYDIDSRLEQFKTVFRNRKDRYRRYRDLSAFCFIGVYLLSVVDAYVDAQLSVFDISPDLSLQVTPAAIETFNGLQRNHSMGFGATLTF